MNEYYSQLSEYINKQNLDKANGVIMNELANLFIKNREDFVYLLSNAGIEADSNMSDGELIELYIRNIHNNKKLQLGTAFLISHNNKVTSFDGELEHSESGIKATQKVLYNYFDADHFDNFHSKEEVSNAGGVGSAIAAVAQLGSAGLAAQQRKKHGAADLFNKKQDAKNQLIQSVLAQRKSQSDAVIIKEQQSAKTIRTVLIVTGSVAAIGLIVGIIYFIKKKK